MGPDEFANGAWAWSVRLSRDGRDVTDEHEALSGALGGEGVDAPPDLAPWRADGGALALIATGRAALHNAAVVYLTEERRLRRPAFLLPSRTAQWSPTGDVLLVATNAGADLLRVDRRHHTIRWNLPEGDRTIVGWLSGERWFSVGRFGGAPARVLVFAATGERLREAPLDPNELLPYERERYRGVRRSGYALRLDGGSMAVGSLLDHWTDSRFDPPTGRLALQALRPTSAPFGDHGRSRCRARAVWVELDLVAWAD